jgi:hypothetical protein
MTNLKVLHLPSRNIFLSGLSYNKDHSRKERPQNSNSLYTLRTMETEFHLHCICILTLSILVILE